ncbi:hypothetical protein FNV65_29750 [Streptomyces sp. S1A1-8]|uniref:hypothetical protein n=1 Tax=unclassified Streptomyces TaxID=2593676 RepID=UPI001162388E|nr:MULTISPECIES: hypothetical protein [unclassified Streptomyces]QDN99832.1 hypothetical protein FNV58_31180 [Streptomyces sp. RLB1-9]QDO21563.1 hypothetical protein FNV65_29750 [Streptomyces sp. S1A1-8]QDO31687.1 hypothetical protein FNV63_29770 [Streptomyces sp. S1A1-3]
MTELSTEPVAVEAAPTAPPPPPDTPSTPTPAAAEVDHTPGGWPVVPLALSGANTTVGMVAAASLAGGPIAAMVAATGAVVLGTVAATRSHKPGARREQRRAAARTAGRAAARTTGLHRGSAGRTGTGSRSLASRTGRMPGQHSRGSGTAARHGSTSTSGKTRGSAHGSPKSTHGAAGRAGQVRALRAAQQAAGGSRAGQRAQTTAARRAVADARRNAKATGGAGFTGRAGRRGGLAVRMLGGAARRARAVRDAAIVKNRARRDNKARATVDAQRGAVRKAPARKAARSALWRSAARFHGRRLLAALLALPVGLLGFLTSPIGRKLKLPWLIHPGRRLYRRLCQTAHEQRNLRDDAIREELDEREAAADAEAVQDGTDGIADHIQRPATQVPTSTNTPVSEGEHVSGFRFEEVASEMEQAANSYDPEDAMEILAMVEGLPAALASVANVMKILAERSDNEFPLEKEVADAFNDIFGALMSAVAVAEDMGPLFRQVHAQDIARHEDPRNGPQAEKGWNV